ncbi:hypothetical protein LEP1GSC037_4337 [Leptospira interrogans str. 2006001854]|uniref:Uncharacterized protein n=1 Tax=Leptospira interrogans str. 2006001854 TaxID=1001590 RepID=M6GPU5_LEPIR|nr:hypothetical protein LEP1GSC037_4337 [Leptospira interrogans str. 2006001854]
MPNYRPNSEQWTNNVDEKESATETDYLNFLFSRIHFDSIFIIK